MVLGILLMVLFPETFGFDSVRRYFRYLGKTDPEKYGTVQFDASGVSAVGTCGDGVILGTTGGCYYFKLDGEQKLMIQGVVSDPCVLANDRFSVCYSMTGTFLSMIDSDGKKLMDENLSGPILDVDLAQDGYLSYSISENGGKCVATVLDPKQEPIYRYHSNTQYLSTCAIAPGGKHLALIGLGESNSTFSATLSVLDTGKEIIAGSDESQASVARYPLGNQYVYDARYLSENRLCLLAQDSAAFFDNDAQLLAEYDYSAGHLRGFAFGGSGFVVLLLSRSVTGDQYTLVTLDENGNVITETQWNRSIRSMSARGNYFAVLTDTAMYVFTKEQRNDSTLGEIGAATTVLMREDGSAILVENGKAVLFLP